MFSVAVSGTMPTFTLCTMLITFGLVGRKMNHQKIGLIEVNLTGRTLTFLTNGSSTILIGDNLVSHIFIQAISLYSIKCILLLPTSTYLTHPSDVSSLHPLKNSSCLEEKRWFRKYVFPWLLCQTLSEINEQNADISFMQRKHFEKTTKRKYFKRIRRNMERRVQQ